MFAYLNSTRFQIIILFSSQVRIFDMFLSLKSTSALVPIFKVTAGPVTLPWIMRVTVILLFRLQTGIQLYIPFILVFFFQFYFFVEYPHNYSIIFTVLKLHYEFNFVVVVVFIFRFKFRNVHTGENLTVHTNMFM